MRVDEEKIKLEIWDTAGQEKYHALNPIHYRGAQGTLNQYLKIILSGALIVYDITDVDSFAKVKVWVNELHQYLEPQTPIVIAGNKCDISNRQIPLEDAEE